MRIAEDGDDIYWSRSKCKFQNFVRREYDAPCNYFPFLVLYVFFYFQIVAIIGIIVILTVRVEFRTIVLDWLPKLAGKFQMCLKDQRNQMFLSLQFK